MKVARIMLLTTLVFLQASVPIMAGGWTLNSVSDVTPGGTIGCSGDAVVSSSYTVTISYKLNSTVTDLTSKSDTTHYMQNDWSKDFDPTNDYNPPSTWPITANDSTKIMQAKLVSGNTSIIKFFECNTAP